eukprot:CAMPEP_0115507794 /NCGR_PEP_ID=MMETSP0271-20121206/71933_1 /TAXON_ID=71861 /ORGANISM="Scrippsiella trochoidea, Strain CCMP3099" /LENGTH=57 /DNA_ID=CAMNT_0002937443 /DNA_START=6 /DNA_END=176 /DNA_ORIENTATION=-
MTALQQGTFARAIILLEAEALVPGAAKCYSPGSAARKDKHGAQGNASSKLEAWHGCF